MDNRHKTINSLARTDGRTDNVKTGYPHTKFAGGIMIGGTLTTVIHNV